MNPAFLVRFRPSGPWRIGVDSGARDRVDRIFHSDAVFSAVSQAMLRLGRLEEWLAATATATGEPAVRLSSLFPFLDEIQFVPPPRGLWPPPPSPKVRWRNARFVPLSLVRDLVAEKQLHDSRWFLDGSSGCLLPNEPRDRSGPFRVALRSHAAVDRVSGAAVEVHRTACLEFAPGAGLWGVVSFADEDAEARWSAPLQAAFRVLADTGFGGERSLGWGRSEQPEFIAGWLPDLIVPEPVRPPLPPAPPATALELLRAYKSASVGQAVPPAQADQPAGPTPEPSTEATPEQSAESVAEPAPKPAPAPAPKRVETGYWLLSLFTPAPDDAVDWQRGSYTLAERGGRVESPARSGDAKKILRMVEEGSVLVAPAAPRGWAADVAPEGFPHPVFRCGFALAVAIPVRGDR